MFLLILNGEAGEAHEGHGHESDGDKRNAESLQRLGYVAVGHLLADSCEADDGESPSESAAEGIGDGVAEVGDGLCVGGVEADALLHEERGTHDGAVDGDEGQEDAQRVVERGAELLDDHLHQLHDAGDDGNEQDEREKREVNAGHEAVGAENLGLQQVVDGERDELDKGDGDAEAKGRLDVLRHGKVRAHTEEERENHVVHEYRADE